MVDNTKFVATEGEGVPPDSYRAKIEGFENYTENEAQYGPGYRVNYRITTGKHEGEYSSRIFSKKFSKKANLRKFAEILNEGSLEIGEEFDFGEYVGMPGHLVVAETESGSYRAETFVPDFENWKGDEGSEVEEEVIDEDELDEDDLNEDDLDDDLDDKPEKPTPRRKTPKKSVARSKSTKKKTSRRR